MHMETDLHRRLPVFRHDDSRKVSIGRFKTKGKLIIIAINVCM